MHAPLTIGILDLQGCVQEHLAHLKALGVEVVRVRSALEMDSLDGLIIPGGESTTMLKLLDTFKLRSPLVEAANNIPFWGICAGAILMAREVDNAQAAASAPTSPTRSMRSLNLLDVTAQRNAYGRQRDSFSTVIRGNTVAFIRAPQITRVASTLEIVDQYKANPVLVRDPVSAHQISTFHAELGDKVPSVFHQEFVNSCASKKAERMQNFSRQEDPKSLLSM